MIQLKRFSSGGSLRSKLEAFVAAPTENLDMELLMDSKVHGESVYDLFAVSNHFGGLGGGHCNVY